MTQLTFAIFSVKPLPGLALIEWPCSPFRIEAVAALQVEAGVAAASRRMDARLRPAQ